MVTPTKFAHVPKPDVPHRSSVWNRLADTGCVLVLADDQFADGEFVKYRVCCPGCGGGRVAAGPGDLVPLWAT